jgi:hypothetical protein
MYEIQSYLYDNIILVQILDQATFLPPRNRTVFSQPIKVYQGIDNPLQIVVRNQQQKAADISGYNVQLDIQDPFEKGAVESLAVTVDSAATGKCSVTIPRATTVALKQRMYYATLKLINTSTNAERPLYMDDNFGAQLKIEVLPGWYESDPLNFAGNAVIDSGQI